MSITVTYSATFDNYSDWNASDGLYTDNELETGFVNEDGFLPFYNNHFEIADHSANPGAFAGAEDPNPEVDLGMWGAFGTFSGTQYASEGEASSLDLGFIVQAASGEYLNYTFFAGPTHTLYGEIGSITFGSGLSQDANGEFYFTEELVTIDGLDTIGLNGGLDANGDVIDRNDGDNDTHNIINGLKDGDASALWAVLDDAGYSEVTLTSLAGVVESSQAELELAA
ncbi:heme acquisition protein HasA [Alloalcanivorax mobilis]|uniref:heme acquisition protein HasA n=1 Tax=Alloalcanivorax mobilis TaxID=2019569 RepID=UPI000C78826C|nr:heme acquisition protein HasA [Alloalcanivorax mobilis]